MATGRKEIEERLRLNKVQGLPLAFKKVAEQMAIKYLQKYSIKGSGYELSYELVKNRVENLMLDALRENPYTTPKEFAEKKKFTEIFIDPEAIMYLVELTNQGLLEEYFVYANHFFSLSVCSYMNHHAFYVKALEKSELMSILYTQVYVALKKCAEKRVMFNFRTLNFMFQASVYELNGVTRFPFSLGRRDIDQYFRFRATVINNNYGKNNMDIVSELLSIPMNKVLYYWEILGCERNGFLSTSLLLEDENMESLFGGMEEASFNDIEIEEMRNRLFDDEVDRNIFDNLLGNGDGTFTKTEIQSLGTTRYHINQVKETIRKNSNHLKPIQ